MSLRLTEANTVVVARNFNLTVVNQAWLLKTGILTQEEMDGEYAFTTLFTQINSKEFAFLLSPERLQFAPKIAGEKQQELILRKVGKFVEALPHTPYVAIGMNFSVQYQPKELDVKDMTRRLFFVPESPLHQEFDTPDARFGGYMSMDALGCRLKMEVKPTVQVGGSDNPRHFISLDFNFHQDLEQGEVAVKDIEKTLNKWNEAKEMSIDVAKKLAGRDRI